MVSNEYSQKSVFRNLEFLVRKHKEDHDAELNTAKQEIQGRIKNLQEDINSRIEVKEVIKTKFLK